MRPVTVVIARPIVAIEIAIQFAGGLFLTGYGIIVGVLGVVAGTQTFRILLVYDPVFVIVQAIAAGVDLPIATCNLTSVRRSVRARVSVRASANANEVGTELHRTGAARAKDCDENHLDSRALHAWPLHGTVAPSLYPHFMAHGP
jgi:hypothetical protein